MSHFVCFYRSLRAECDALTARDAKRRAAAVLNLTATQRRALIVVRA